MSPLVVGLLDRLPGVPEALLVQVVEDLLVAGREGARFDSVRPHGFRGRLAKVDRHPVRRTHEDESASLELARAVTPESVHPPERKREPSSRARSSAQSRSSVVGWPARSIQTRPSPKPSTKAYEPGPSRASSSIWTPGNVQSRRTLSGPIGSGEPSLRSRATSFASFSFGTRSVSFMQARARRAHPRARRHP